MLFPRSLHSHQHATMTTFLTLKLVEMYVYWEYDMTPESKQATGRPTSSFMILISETGLVNGNVFTNLPWRPTDIFLNS